MLGNGEDSLKTFFPLSALTVQLHQDDLSIVDIPVGIRKAEEEPQAASQLLPAKAAC